MFNIPGVHDLGIDDFEITMMVDCTLHTLDLGVAERYNGEAVKHMLTRNIYNMPQSSLKERMIAGMLRIKRDLKLFYKAEDKKRADGNKCNRIKKLHLGTLGSLDTPCLKAKGAQSRAFVKFAVDTLKAHAEALDTTGKLLLQAGLALFEYYDILQAEHRKMPFAAHNHLLTCAKNHLACYQAAGGHMVPKHHMMLHLTLSSKISGNPAYFSTYEDEHENGIVAKMCLAAHGLTFHMSTFERLVVLEGSH